MTLAHQRFSADELADLLGQHRPTAEQRSVIEAPLEPALVVAGAGSGKTETMSARVVYLVANAYVRPEEILGLTFGRKATSELSGRIRSRLAQLRERFARDPGDDERAAELLAGEPAIATYHSYAARLVDEHGLRLGLEPAARVLTPSPAWQYVDAAVRSYAGDLSAMRRAASTVAEDVLALSGELAEHLVDPGQLRRWTDEFDERVRALPAGTSRGSGPGGMIKETTDMLAVGRFRLQLLPLVEQYRQRKRDAREVDFGDLLSFAARLAAEHDTVGSAERARFPVVLLDEYQDTSHAQRVLLRSLFGSGHPVTAVGDPCQSIYGWRGASAGNLQRFPDDFRTGAGERAVHQQLSISWRNGERILDAAEVLAGPLRATGAPVARLRPAPAAVGTGAVRCALLPSAVEEAEWLATEIERRWSAQPRGSVAVLCRARKQFPLIERALLARGIPVEIVGLGGLLDEPEIVDVVSTLAVLADPGAGDRLARLITGPRWRIGPRDLVALGRRARHLIERTRALARQSTDGCAEAANVAVNTDTDNLGEALPERDEQPSLVDALDDMGRAEQYSPQGFDRLRALADELATLRRWVDAPLPELIAAIERTTLLDIEVVVNSPHQAAIARSRLDRFLDVAADFARDDERATVTAFLGYLAAAAQQERGLDPGTVEATDDRVQLLTVHAAKGLEWDVVAIPGVVAKAFPDTTASPEWTKSPRVLPTELRGDRADLPALQAAALADQKDLTEARKVYTAANKAHDLLEERRLAYVAMTRARHDVLCSGYWWGETGVKLRGPSEFLVEIAESCVRAGQSNEPWCERPDEELTNPLLVEPPAVPWPLDPLGERRARVVAAAEKVSAAGDPTSRRSRPRSPAARDSLDRWRAEAELLLSERDRRASASHATAVPLPEAVSVSALVALRRDPVKLAARLRRPVPAKPAPLARRGTAFHTWLEELFATARLLDLDELPGSADEGAAPDAELAELKARFLASEWADRRPDRIEEPFETRIAGLPVRGRIDAVFLDRSGLAGEVTWEVIDWKTGQVPTGADADAAAVQLAVYRVAWAELHAGGDVQKVSAAFHYVRADRTLRPSDLLDREQLEQMISSVPTA